VRLIDSLVRQGHLSEEALTEAILTGERPRHLDRCDICGDRAVELGHWLNDVKAMAVGDADEAFSAERLTAQRHQVMRRLEQVDAPPRVIEFPVASARLGREPGSRRVAPAWVGVAAAAGLVVGVIGGHFTASSPAAETTTEEAAAPAAPQPAGRVPVAAEPDSSASPDLARASQRGDEASVLEMDLDAYTPDTLRVFDEATPRLVSYTVSRR
jgi:hypothetical protein